MIFASLPRYFSSLYDESSFMGSVFLECLLDLHFSVPDLAELTASEHVNSVLLCYFIKNEFFDKQTEGVKKNFIFKEEFYSFFLFIRALIALALSTKVGWEKW